MTSGLGCDGDTVALTAATSPSLEDLLTGAIPGTPGVVIYNPMLAFETGDDLMRAWYDAERGQPRSLPARARGVGAQRADQRRGPLGRASASTPRPASRSRPCSWIDRLAPKAAAVMAIGTCAAYGGDPGDEEQPDRRHGPARLPGPRLDLAPRHPDRQPARLPGPAQQHHRDAARARAAAQRAGADDRPRRPGPAALAVRPDRPRDLQPARASPSRARSPTRWATTSGASSSSGARGPVVNATSPCAAGSTGSAAARTSAASASAAPHRASPIASCRSGARPPRAAPTARGARFTYGPVLRYFRDRRMRTTYEREPEWRRPGDRAADRPRAPLVSAPCPSA